MATSSQEEHIGTLLEALNPVRDISKNWGIDLAQHLETYLEQIALENGMNFVEAALLIQNSAVIYVKKVDYVWIISQQLLETLRKRKFGEEKKATQILQDDVETELEVDGETPVINKNKNRKEKEDDKDKSKYGEINIEVSEKLLELEPSKEKRKPWKLLPDVYHQFQKKPLSQRRAFVDVDADDPQEEQRFKVNQPVLPNCILHHELQEPHHPAFTVRPSFFIAATLDNSAELAMNEDMSLTCGNDDNVDAPLEDAPPEVPQSDDNTDEVRVGDRIRRRECAAAIPPAVIVADTWEPIPLEETKFTDDKPSRLKTAKLPCDPNLLDIALVTNQKRKADDPHPERRPPKALTRWFLDAMRVRFGKLINGEIIFQTINDLSDPGVIEKREKARKKWRKFSEIRYQMKEEFDDFEDFKGFEDYDTQLPCEANGFLGFGDIDEEEDDCVDNDRLDNEDRCDDRVGDGFCVDLATQLDGPLICDDAAARMADDSAVEPVVEVETAEQRVENGYDLAKRVREWHDSIRPALAAANRRTHFDIHEYGARIIEKFPSDGGRHTLGLRQLVSDVDTQDVSRYFLAALQLANTYNVEISSPEQELGMDQISLTLLSARRYHEELEDYVAPSQEESAGAPACSTSVHLARANTSRTDNTKTTRTLQTGRKRKL